MARHRPARLKHIAGIGVDRMGSIADASGRDFLRLENLDVDIPPDPAAIERTRAAAAEDDANSYLPFVGQTRLRVEHFDLGAGLPQHGDQPLPLGPGHIEVDGHLLVHPRVDLVEHPEVLRRAHEEPLPPRGRQGTRCSARVCRKSPTSVTMPRA